VRQPGRIRSHRPIVEFERFPVRFFTAAYPSVIKAIAQHEVTAGPHRRGIPWQGVVKEQKLIRGLKMASWHLKPANAWHRLVELVWLEIKHGWYTFAALAYGRDQFAACLQGKDTIPAS
jgi:hypothetical protein